MKHRTVPGKLCLSYDSKGVLRHGVASTQGFKKDQSSL